MGKFLCARLLTGGLFLAASGSDLLGGAPPAWTQEEGIEGRVMDAVTGVAIGGARVEIEGGGVAATTDADGRFRLPRAPRPGEVLVVRADGYETRKLSGPEIPLPQTEVELRPAILTLREYVVVTATRTETRLSDVPGNVTVLDRRDLSTTPTANLADALATMTGLNSFTAWGNPLDFGLDPRGITGGGFSSYLLVLVDGMPVNDIDSALVDWNLLPTDQIWQVEVQRGPGSALYGDMSLGGVVNVLTEPLRAGSITSLSSAGGSFGDQEVGVDHRGGSSRMTYAVSGFHRELDGYRARSAWSSDSLTGRVRVELGRRSSLTVSTLNHWLENETPGPLSQQQLETDRAQAGYPFDGWDQRRNLFGVKYQYQLDGGTGWFLDLFHRRKDSDQVLTLPLEMQIGGVLVPLFDVKKQALEGRITGLQGRFEHPVQWNGAKHRLLAGAEASAGHLDSRYQSVNDGVPGTVVADGSGSRRVYGLYFQDQISDVGPLGFSLGARYDRFDDEFTERVAGGGRRASDNNAVSPKLGMTWSYRTDGDLFIQAGGGFRAPTLEQLFDERSPFGASLSNSDLKPQKSTDYEIGIRQAFAQRADLQVSVYSMRLRNEIEFDPVAFQFNNIGRSQHRGAELSLTGHFRPGLDGFLNYTLQDATHESGEAPGKQIIFVPRHLGSLGLRFGVGKGWLGSVVFRAVGRQFMDDTNEHAIESYATLDAQMGYRWRQLELFVAGANLLDRRYSTSGFITPRTTISPGPSLEPTIMSYPAPTRSLRTGIRWNY